MLRHQARKPSGASIDSTSSHRRGNCGALALPLQLGLPVRGALCIHVHLLNSDEVIAHELGHARQAFESRGRGDVHSEAPQHALAKPAVAS